MSDLITRDRNPSVTDFRTDDDDTLRPDSCSPEAFPASGGPDCTSDEFSATGQPVLYLAALISVSAAFIHLVVVPEHFAEWIGYGVFFLVAAVLQAAFALVVIRRPSRAVLIAGIAGNLAIVAMWAITRTIGVPFFGPGAGEIEEIGVHDVVATAAEIALVLLLVQVIVPRTGSDELTPAES